jgi:hypothetical protein
VPPTLENTSELTDSAVAIEGAKSVLRLAAGPALEVGAPALQVPASDCSLPMDGLQWSNLDDLDGAQLVVSAVEETVDGCLKIVFGEPSSGGPEDAGTELPDADAATDTDAATDAEVPADVDDAGALDAGPDAVDAGRSLEDAASSLQRTVFFCLPRWAFVFVPGDRVFVTTEESEEGSGAALKILHSDLESELEIVSGIDPVEDARILHVAQAECEPRQLTCGAVSEPLSVTFDIASTPLGAGESARVDLGEQSRHVYLGRAERVLLGRPACDPVLQRAGARVDFLSLRTNRTVP